MIDRSKPLPIHEFPSMISEVAGLKAHCAQQPGYFAVLERLLDVLGETRARDAQTIDEIIENFTFHGDKMSGVYVECLIRYRDIAKKMEESI